MKSSRKIWSNSLGLDLDTMSRSKPYTTFSAPADGGNVGVRPNSTTRATMNSGYGMSYQPPLNKPADSARTQMGGVSGKDQDFLNRYMSDVAFRRQVASTSEGRDSFRRAFLQASAGNREFGSQFFRGMNDADAGRRPINPIYGIATTAERMMSPSPIPTVGGKTQKLLTTPPIAPGIDQKPGKGSIVPMGYVSGLAGGQPGSSGNGVKMFNGNSAYSMARGVTAKSSASAPVSLTGAGSKMAYGGMSGQGLMDQQSQSQQSFNQSSVQSSDQSNEPLGIDAFGRSKSAYQSSSSKAFSQQSQPGIFSGITDQDMAKWTQMREYEEGIASRKRREDRNTMFWSMFAQNAARMFEPYPIDPSATARMASQWR